MRGDHYFQQNDQREYMEYISFWLFKTIGDLEYIEKYFAPKLFNDYEVKYFYNDEVIDMMKEKCIEYFNIYCK